MAGRAQKICARSGCPKIAVRRGLCETHAAEVDAVLRKRYPDKRPDFRQRGYTAAWDRLRAAYIKKHPDCEGCGKTGPQGMIVDHIKPKDEGGEDKWDNCQTLCRTCHGIKTKWDKRRAAQAQGAVKKL